MKMICMLLACLMSVGCRKSTSPSGAIRTERHSGTWGFHEITYRGDNLVLTHFSNGVNNTQARIFHFSGRVAFAESDEDGDGFFETLTVYGDTTSTFDMFTRELDGSVKPVSTSDLAIQVQKGVEASERFQMFQSEVHKIMKENSKK